MPAALATLGFVSSDFQQSAAHLILFTHSKQAHTCQQGSLRKAEGKGETERGTWYDRLFMPKYLKLSARKEAKEIL